MCKSVAFHNLGCKVNSYETEIMMKEMAENGYIIVPFDQKADIYVVNTCSVTNIADRKSRQMLHRARSMNPGALIIAAGCYVDTHDAAETKNEGVDICVSNKDKKDIVRIINDHYADKGFTCGAAVSGNKCVELSGKLKTRCFIKVQDGCDQFCSYCIIPYARGRISSRRISEIVEETKRRVKEGYKEFVPTGIHISSYGKDRPEDKEDLLMLIRQLSETEGVQRIRLSSLEPRIVTEEFAKALSGIDQICPHFHLSLQSGSDAVLKRMNRHYTTDEYLNAVDILRRYFRDPAITTDIITGFPGETEEEFEKTVSFADRVNFYETHIFKYSRRRGTVADKMQGQLEESEKHRRSLILIEMNNRKKKAFENLHISDKLKSEVLFEDMEEAGGALCRTGYTREYIKVYEKSGKYRTGDIAEGILERQGDWIYFKGE